MKKLLLFLVALLVVVPASAQTINLTFGYKTVPCTQQLVNAGHCSDADNTLVVLDTPPGDLGHIVDGFSHWVGWTPTVICTQELVNSGDCTTEELNQAVANPTTKARAAELAFEELIRRLVEKYYLEQYEASLPPKPSVTKQ